MRTKLSIVKENWDNGNKIMALRVAAKFQKLGNEKRAITKAWSAYTNPDFYKQLGQDPNILIAEGLEALKQRYKL